MKNLAYWLEIKGIANNISSYLHQAGGPCIARVYIIIHTHSYFLGIEYWF